MAISTVTNRVNYQCNGTSAVFNFPYQFNASTELSVFIYNSSVSLPNMVRPFVLNTDYVISPLAQTSNGIYKNGADIIVNSTPNSQSVIVMFRSSAVTNDFFVPQFGGVNSVGLNNELDRLTLIAQRLQDQVTRAVRLQDGYFGPFDPTLPPNISMSPNKRLIVNSNATGFTLDEGLGGYIPNTLIYSPNGSSIASLGGAAAGLVLQSNGSSAPTWAAISLSGSSVAGTLSLGNGGTGGLAPQQWGVVFASSATQLATTDPAPVGLPLISNASSGPSFQKLALLTAGSGILQAINGGTGQGAAFTPFAVPYAASATALAFTSPGPIGFALVSNGSSSIPTFQAVTAISSGILAVTSGGTGNGATLNPQGILFASSANQVAVVAPAAAGFVLTSAGSSAPSFQAPPAPNLTAGSGILPVVSGGTGQGVALTPFGVVYAASATAIGIAPSAAAGLVLTANGSSAPSFQTVSAVQSGIVAVTSGGTGVGATLAQWGVLYASSTTQVGVVPTATVGFVLTANGSSAPTFQAAASGGGSVNSGVVAVGFGGTGNGTSYTQFGLIYASNTTQFSSIALGGAGTVLTSNGSSAPSWQAAPGSTPGRMSYSDAGGATINNAFTTFSFGQKISDPASIFSAGILTIPRAGDWQMGFLGTIGTALGTGVGFRGQIVCLQNSSVKMVDSIFGNGSNNDYPVKMSGIVACSTGHQFAYQFRIGSGSPTMSTTPGYTAAWAVEVI